MSSFIGVIGNKVVEAGRQLLDATAPPEVKSPKRIAPTYARPSDDAKPSQPAANLDLIHRGAGEQTRAKSNGASASVKLEPDIYRFR